jgi:GINS complex subunit 4
MIDSPDLDTAVFVRMLKDGYVEARGRDSDGGMDAKRGDVVVARWADVKDVVERGDAELI